MHTRGDESRDQGDASTKQGIPTMMASEPPKARREVWSTFSLMASEGTVPGDTLILDLWPPGCKVRNSCCLNPPCQFPFLCYGSCSKPKRSFGEMTRTRLSWEHMHPCPCVKCFSSMMHHNALGGRYSDTTTLVTYYHRPILQRMEQAQRVKQPAHLAGSK